MGWGVSSERRLKWNGGSCSAIKESFLEVGGRGFRGCYQSCPP